MKILLIYGTNSGGTLEASEIMRDTLVDAGHEVVLKNAKDAQPGDLHGYQLTIFGSCTWELVQEGNERLEGQLQEHWLGLRERLKGQTAPGTYAVFALGDQQYAKFAGAADHLAGIVKSLGGTLKGEPLRINGFYFHPENRDKVIAWTKGLVS